MKFQFNHKAYIGICLYFAAILLITGCEKNTLRLSNTEDPSSGSFLKLGWFSPSINTQGVILRVNGVALSNQIGFGFSSTSNYAMPYPGGGLNTGGDNKNDYLSVPAGEVAVSLVIPKKGTAIDSIVVLAPTAIKTDAGKYYSFMVADSFPAVSSFLLNDDASYADSGYFKLRFTNAIPNAGTVDFLLTNTRVTDSLVATGIDYKSSTGFITLPYVTGAVSFKIRKTGTTTIYNATPYSTSSLTNKRVYSMVARGYVGATGTRAVTYSYIFNK